VTLVDAMQEFFDNWSMSGMEYSRINKYINKFLYKAILSRRVTVPLLGIEG
jgi:hypothetical protein